MSFWNWLKSVLAWPFEVITGVVVFIAGFFKEADGNGGKPSFTRLSGGYVIWNIIALGWQIQGNKDAHIPTEWMTLFWVLIGYQVVGRLLSSLSPAVLDIVRGWMLKAGATVTVPPPQPPQPGA